MKFLFRFIFHDFLRIFTRFLALFGAYYIICSGLLYYTGVVIFFSSAFCSATPICHDSTFQSSIDLNCKLVCLHTTQSPCYSAVHHQPLMPIRRIYPFSPIMDIFQRKSPMILGMRIQRIQRISLSYIYTSTFFFLIPKCQ